MKKSFKKLSVVLLAFAAGQVQAKDVYQPKTPWPFAPFEDAAVGAGSVTAEVVTAGHADTGNGASGLAVAVPDAVPGVSYARGKDRDESEEKTTKRQKRKNKKETSSSKSSKNKKKKRSNDDDDSSY